MQTPTKCCAKCGKEFPATPEYFRPSRKSLRNSCRQCAREKARQYDYQHAEERRQYKKQYYRDHAEGARKKARHYYADHKEERRDYNRLWREKNPDKSKKSTQHWRDKNPEKVKLTGRQSSSRYYRKHPSKAKKSAKLWRDSNTIKVRGYTLRRRAQKRKLPSTFTDADWECSLNYFHGCCAYCGRPPGLWHTLARDHFVPVSKNGGYTPNNIVPACHGEGGCNNAKSDSDASDWLGKKFGKRQAKAILKRIKDYFEWIENLE